MSQNARLRVLLPKTKSNVPLAQRSHRTQVKAGEKPCDRGACAFIDKYFVNAYKGAQ